MSLDGLSAPGASQYSSNTLKVGDGTWDSTRDSFLLPNLVGLNLETTQYNGMGNRFRELLPYHSLIKAHGAIAAIIFLFLIPTAITVARFYQGNRQRAIHIHIWIQILVVFLLTVVLMLGWFAVGPQRSLTNPHHGIGVALYTLVMVQVIGGAIVRRREKYKSRDYLPVKMMLHHWLGRSIAILGLAQVPLGLALYGAAKVFFILYAIAVATWIVIYFVLSHRYQSERFIGSGYGSYVSSRRGPRSEAFIDPNGERKSSFWRNTALAGGAIAGWRALRGRRERRLEDERVVVEDADERRTRPHSAPRSRLSRRPSGSFIEEEKYSNIDGGGNRTWRDRLVGAGAGLAAFEGARRLFGRRRTTGETRIDEYGRPPIGDNSSVSHADVSRVQAGQAPYSPGTPRRTRHTRTSTIDSPLPSPSLVRPTRGERVSISHHDSALTSPSRVGPPNRRSRLRPRRSGSFSSVDSIESTHRPVATPVTTGGWTTRDGIAATIAGITGLSFLRRKQQERRERREERRADELRRYDEEIAERVDRTQKHRPGFDGTVVDETVETRPTTGPIASSRVSVTGTAAPPLPVHGGTHHSVAGDTISTVHRPRPGYPVDGSAVQIPTGPGPAPGAHFTEANTSRVRFEDDPRTTAGASAAAALATQQLLSDKRHGRDTTTDTAQTVVSTTDSSANAAPVAVKVNIHDDNEHITLRRLNPAELAAEREKRRRERRTRNRLRRGSIASSDSDIAGPSAGYRRTHRSSATAPIAPVPAPALSPGTSSIRPSAAHPLPPPPPGPVPSTGVYLGGPKTYIPNETAAARPTGMTSSPPVALGQHGAGYMSTTGTGTDMSAFDEARRRRRAERAAAAKVRALEGDDSVPPVRAGRGEARGEYV